VTCLVSAVGLAARVCCPYFCISGGTLSGVYLQLRVVCVVRSLTRSRLIVGVGRKYVCLDFFFCCVGI